MNHPRQILTRYGLDPRKSLGQNFLFDESILNNITALAELTERDSVLEIGPGLGALTRHLAKSAGRVVAVELDQRLLPILQSFFADDLKVELLTGDFLFFQADDHFEGAYKVVANVPYYITGAILRHIYQATVRPTIAVLTVQEEVADRITARPGKMSLLAISVQIFAQASKAFSIKAGAFWPRPEVDSAVVRLDLHPTSLLSFDEEASFFAVANVCFSQKRKQIQKSLRSLVGSREEIERALIKANIDGSRRPETLSIDEWLALHRQLANKPPP